MTEARPIHGRPEDVGVLGPRVAITGWDYFARRATDLLQGTSVRPYRAVPTSRLSYFRQLLMADVVFGIGGRRSLSRAERAMSALGAPIVLGWYGTDVLADAPHAGDQVRNGTVTWCDAPWLKDELEDAGFPDVHVVPLTFPSLPAEIAPLPARLNVLAYVPEGREEIYCLDVILELAATFPDLDFTVLARDHLPRQQPNVHCTGWVDDVATLIDRSSVLIRPVRHDGLSHLVLEAMAHGRHVLWSYSIPGATQVPDMSSWSGALAQLVATHSAGELGLNVEGRAEVERNYLPEPVAEKMATELNELWRSTGKDRHTLRALRTLRRVLGAAPQ